MNFSLEDNLRPSIPSAVFPRFSNGEWMILICVGVRSGEDMGMTVATYLTLGRILLIPVFVLFAVYYGRSVSVGEAQEWLRWAAVGTFVLASVTDALDGWVARQFNQRSRLGALLDPLADKGLLLTALITLSVSDWRETLPLWFAVLVIARDVVILVGCALLHHMHGHLEVRPSLLGKTATAAQMVTLAWVMLQLPFLMWPVVVAGVLTFGSGAGYLVAGVRLSMRHEDAVRTESENSRAFRDRE